ncbi:hypothetical protein [Streptomyces sp. NPDC004589]|uniref:hypothetical protein n=1 Tax=Streptomyces sp. NPDC004589 TaxID=3154553 RepID=UPI0033B5E813
MPALSVERLEAAHPGDDDHVYFLGDRSGMDRVPLDIHPGGRPSFFLEADGRVRTSDVTEAVEVVVAWLRSGDTPDHRAATVEA